LIAYVQKKGKIKQGIRRKSKGKKDMLKNIFIIVLKLANTSFPPPSRFEDYDDDIKKVRREAEKH